MNVTRWMGLVLAFALLGTPGCGDDSGNSGSMGDGGTNDDASMIGQDGSLPSDGGGGVVNDGLQTPAMTTLATGPWPGGTAQVCQEFVMSTFAGVPSEIDWTFDGGNCVDGNYYLDFNEYNGAYDIAPGTVLGDDGMPGDAVQILTASDGTLDMNRLTDIPEDTDVTITTNEWTITFSISGSTVTISAWDPA